MNQENPTKAIFKSILSDDGTWLYRYCNEIISIFKGSPSYALKEIIHT
jgi:hypothetical protein